MAWVKSISNWLGGLFKDEEHDWCGPPPGSRGGVDWLSGLRGALLLAAVGLVVFAAWAALSVV